MSQLITVPANSVSGVLQVSQYSIVQVIPSATPCSISVLYSQDKINWAAWPSGTVTSTSSLMSNANMSIFVSAQSSDANVSISDPQRGITEILQSPWVGTTLGQILEGSSTAAAPGYSFVGDSATGIYRGGTAALSFSVGGTARASMVSGDVRLRGGTVFGFSSVDPTNTAIDVALQRDAADTLAVRHSTSSQTLRVYGSFGASSSFVALIHDGTNAVVSTQGGGLQLSASTMGFFGVNVTTKPGATGTSFASLSLSSGALASTLAIALNTLGLINCTSVSA